MVDVVTYHSTNTKNPAEAWVGYILLPRDGRQLTVRFSGSDEKTVIDRANAFWEKHGTPLSGPSPEPGRGKSFANKTWLYNRTTGERTRVSDDEVENYLAKGFIKAGPRTT